jgi:hemoglobin
MGRTREPRMLGETGINAPFRASRDTMSRTIYRDIGGRDAVEAVVDDFYDRVLADERLAPYFDGMDMDELRSHQVQFISAVAGGPVEYSGVSMREAHAHLGIEEADFDLVGRYLQEALEANGVGGENVEAIMAEVVALKDPVLDR